jgi:sirohydrochlorin ferrochelatase
MASGPTLIAVAHGSRRPAAQAQVARLLDAVRAERPGLAVREAYIELAAPSLPDILRSCPGPAVVVPLLLGHGYHIAHDVAGVTAAYRPEIPCAPALGPHPLLVDALVDRLLAAEGSSTRRDTSSDPVVLAAAGSSDPRSHADADATAAMLAVRLGRVVVPAYQTSARPGVVETVDMLRGAGHRRVSVAGYLLWPGRFAAEVAGCGADIVAAPIGVHPALVRLVLARYDAARRAVTVETVR